MKITHRHMHEAISAGARARVTMPATPATWYFIAKTNGERPNGAPPG